MALFEKKKKAQVDPAPVTKATLTRSIVSSAFILTILSVAVLAYITTAWFSSNRKVDNTGVHMNIQTSPNMIIVNAEDPDGTGTTYNAIAYSNFKDLTTAAVDPYNTNNATRVEFHDPYYNAEGTETLLVPVTHDDGGEYSKKLKYLRNPSIIGIESGVKTGNEYSYGNVTGPTVDGSNYYIEHKVLIASASGVLPSSALKATLSAYSVNGTPENNAALTAANHAELADSAANAYQYAASVDFYVRLVTQSEFQTKNTADQLSDTGSTYMGTLNIAGKRYDRWAADGSYNAATVWSSLSDAQKTAYLSTLSAEDRTKYDNADNDGKAATVANILQHSDGDEVLLYSSEIPYNGTTTTNDNCALLVTMRFYFDGALLWKKAGVDAAQADQAYVHSLYLSTAGMPNLYVQFTSVEPTT